MISPEVRKLLADVKDSHALLAFLQEHMTEKRRIRFEEVLNYRTRHFTLAVEDVYQERNASAIVRTADCFGIQDVHIIENHNPYQLSTGIAKGSEKWVNVYIHDRKQNNSLECIRHLREKGYRVMATTPHTRDLVVQDYDISQKTAIFLGGEKEGLSPTVMDHADGFLRIPLFGFTESFNISVAGALILQDLTRRLHHSGIDWKLTEEEKHELRLDWTIRTVASARELIKKYLEGEKTDP